MKPQTLLFRRVVLWLLIMLAVTFVTMQILSLGGENTARSLMALLLTYFMVVNSSGILVYTDLEIHVMPHLWRHQLIRKIRLVAMFSVLGLMAGITLFQYNQFRAGAHRDLTAPAAEAHRGGAGTGTSASSSQQDPNDLSASNSFSSPLYLALLCYKATTYICTSLIAVTVDLVMHHTSACCGLVAALLSLYRYEHNQYLRYVVIKTHRETSEGKAVDSLITDNDGQTLTSLQSLWANMMQPATSTAGTETNSIANADPAAGWPMLKAKLLAPALKHSIAVSLAAIGLSLCGRGLHSLRCAGDTDDTAMSRFDRVLCYGRGAGLDLYRNNSSVAGMPSLPNVAWNACLLTFAIQVLPAMSYLLLRSLLLHPIFFMREEDEVMPNSGPNAAAEGGGVILAATMCCGLVDQIGTWCFSWLPPTTATAGSAANAIGRGSAGKQSGSVLGDSRSSTLAGLPRWQEALRVHRAVYDQLLASVQPTPYGPAIVPWLQTTGNNNIFAFSKSSSGFSLNFNADVARSMAMQSFCAIATGTSVGLRNKRRVLFMLATTPKGVGSRGSGMNSGFVEQEVGGWADAAVGAIAYIDAVSLQLQLIVAHALDVLAYSVGDGMQTLTSDSTTKGALHGLQAMSISSSSTSSSSNAGNKSSSSGSGGAARVATDHGGGYGDGIYIGAPTHASAIRDVTHAFIIPQQVTEIARRGAMLRDKSYLGHVCNHLLASKWAYPLWNLSRALVGIHPCMHVIPPFVLQTGIHAVKGVSAGLIASLRDDSTGTAQSQLVAATESLIRLERSLQLYDTCLRRCQATPGVFILDPLGLPSSATDNGSTVDVPALQSCTEMAVTALVRAFRDVLARGDCPLLQSELCSDVLTARIKKIR